MLSSIAVAVLAGSSAVFATPSVSVSFGGSPKQVTGVDNFNVLTTVTNTGDEDLRLLRDPNSLLTPKWNTQMFDIKNSNGAKPAFKGVKVKYSPKLAAEQKSYETLAPGKSLTITHSLGGVYNFTSTGHSTYEIVPSNNAAHFIHVSPSGELVTLLADVHSGHEATLTGGVVPRSYVGPETPNTLHKRANQFVSCSSSRQSDLSTAAKNAQTYATNTYNYLNGISASTTRYKTWFGTYTSSRHSLVTGHYNNIRNGQLATDTFDCTCTDSGTYAYVYPDTFGYIYLCGAFWSAPATGTDSKAGTLIHESSHFTKNGGTQDYQYGQSAAKSLASSDPDKATMNADNHEYEAENNPALS